MVWWVELQPASREREKLLRVVEDGEQWEELQKGSINGFYNVVVSLGWWVQAATTESEHIEVGRMISDAVWVVVQMLGTTHPAKRGPDTDPLTGHTDKR
jgi:hypothetical protein